MERRPTLNAALTLIALLGTAVFLYLFALDRPVRLDWTREGRFRLTPETMKVLGALTTDIRVTSFYQDGAEARLRMQDHLEEYAARSRRVEFRFVDPDQSPGLAQEYGVKTYGTTVVEAGERRTMLFVPSEAQITAAIVRVTRDGSRTVGVISGHGERDWDDEENVGYARVREALALSRIEPWELLLMRDTIDAGAVDAVVLAGPAKDLLPEERAALEAYLDEGGGLLALVDPGAFPEIEGLLAREGIGLGADIVVDRLSQVFGSDYLVPVVSDYPATDITKDFRLGTFFPVSRSVRILEEGPPGTERFEIARTTPGAWGESDTARLLREGKAGLDPSQDRPGPLALAVQAERPAGTGRARVVVIGDSDFASNAYFGRSGNGDLFQNALAWVMGDEDPASIRPREIEAEPLVLSNRQGSFFFWVPVVLFPGVALAAGAVVLLRRR